MNNGRRSRGSGDASWEIDTSNRGKSRSRVVEKRVLIPFAKRIRHTVPEDDDDVGVNSDLAVTTLGFYYEFSNAFIKRDRDKKQITRYAITTRNNIVVAITLSPTAAPESCDFRPSPAIELS